MLFIMNYDVSLVGDISGLEYSELKEKHVKELKIFVRNITLNYRDYMKSLLEVLYGKPVEKTNTYLTVDAYDQTEPFYGSEKIHRSVSYTIEDIYSDGVSNEVSIRLEVDSSGLKAQVWVKTDSNSREQNESFAETQIKMGSWLNSQVEFHLKTSYVVLGRYSYMITREQMLNNDIDINFKQNASMK